MEPGLASRVLFRNKSTIMSEQTRLRQPRELVRGLVPPKLLAPKLRFQEHAHRRENAERRVCFSKTACPSADYYLVDNHFAACVRLNNVYSHTPTQLPRQLS